MIIRCDDEIRLLGTPAAENVSSGYVKSSIPIHRGAGDGEECCKITEIY